MVKRFSQILENTEKEIQKLSTKKQDLFSSLLKALPQNNREPIRKLYSVITLSQIEKFVELTREDWYFFSNQPSPKTRPDIILVLKNTDGEVILIYPDGAIENVEFTKTETDK